MSEKLFGDGPIVLNERTLRLLGLTESGWNSLLLKSRLSGKSAEAPQVAVYGDGDKIRRVIERYLDNGQLGIMIEKGYSYHDRK